MVYLMMTDLEMNDDYIKDICGWVLVGLLFLALIISLQAIVIDLFKNIMMAFKKLRYKLRLRKAEVAQKYAIQEGNELAKIFQQQCQDREMHL